LNLNGSHERPRAEEKLSLARHNGLRGLREACIRAAPQGRGKTAQFCRATLCSVEKRSARPVWAKHQIGHRLWAAHDAHQKKRIFIAVIAAQMMTVAAVRHGLAEVSMLNAHPS
jgi:hypothetical protein